MLTKDTNLAAGAGVSTRIQFECTYQISSLVDEMPKLISRVDGDLDTQDPCAMLRAFVSRIKALNSVLMSSINDSDTLTLQDGIRAIYGNDEEDFLRNLIEDQASEGRFVPGRDLAVAMIDAGRAVEADGDLCELDGSYRPGRLQNNFAFPFICKLLADPEKAEGFAAVLSSIFGNSNCNGTIPRDFGKLPYSRMYLTDQRRGDRGELIAPRTKKVAPTREVETA